jgi:hypothetical protein
VCKTEAEAGSEDALQPIVGSEPGTNTTVQQRDDKQLEEMKSDMKAELERERSEEIGMMSSSLGGFSADEADGGKTKRRWTRRNGTMEEWDDERADPEAQQGEEDDEQQRHEDEYEHGGRSPDRRNDDDFYLMQNGNGTEAEDKDEVERQMDEEEKRFSQRLHDSNMTDMDYYEANDRGDDEGDEQRDELGQDDEGVESEDDGPLYDEKCTEQTEERLCSACFKLAKDKIDSCVAKCVTKNEEQIRRMIEKDCKSVEAESDSGSMFEQKDTATSGHSFLDKPMHVLLPIVGKDRPNLIKLGVAGLVGFFGMVFIVATVVVIRRRCRRRSTGSDLEYGLVKADESMEIEMTEGDLDGSELGAPIEESGIASAIDSQELKNALKEEP